MIKLIELIKGLPVDLGQASMREKTKGKLIAFNYIESGKGKKALDIGCREGMQSERLLNLGYDVTSIDIEPKYPKAVTLDVNQPLPFDNATYDLIWCSEVIEHLIDPVFSVNEMRRVLKPDGRLIITTPNSYAWFFRLFSIVGLSQKKIQNKGHLHFFCVQDIHKIFPKANVFGYFPYIFFKRKISKGLGLLTPTFVIIEDGK